MKLKRASEEGFLFQVVGMGSKRMGGREKQGMKWRMCRVCGGNPEDLSLPGAKKGREEARPSAGDQNLVQNGAPGFSTNESELAYHLAKYKPLTQTKIWGSVPMS